jgi:hypothetical protein
MPIFRLFICPSQRIANTQNKWGPIKTFLGIPKKFLKISDKEYHVPLILSDRDSLRRERVTRENFHGCKF